MRAGARAPALHLPFPLLTLPCFFLQARFNVFLRETRFTCHCDMSQYPFPCHCDKSHYPFPSFRDIHAIPFLPACGPLPLAYPLRLDNQPSLTSCYRYPSP